MIIDLHFHTKQYSSCSITDIEEGIKRASESGLDGICITEHDVFADRELARKLEEKYGILVIVGVEILTYEGDLICFGLDKVPSGMMHAQQLINLVNEKGGACIAAHPFRMNARGMGEYLHLLRGLHAIESLNGNTIEENNRRAEQMADKLGIPKVGGSDSHSLHQIGMYATRFIDVISSEEDLIEALKKGRVQPVRLR